MRQRFARLLALTLTISFITGSAGIAALAEEADSVSADIVVSDNSDDPLNTAAPGSGEETAAEPADTKTDDTAEEPSGLEAEGAEETAESGSEPEQTDPADGSTEAAERQESVPEDADRQESAVEEPAGQQDPAQSTPAEEDAAEIDGTGTEEEAQTDAEAVNTDAEDSVSKEETPDSADLTETSAADEPEAAEGRDGQSAAVTQVKVETTAVKVRPGSQARTEKEASEPVAVSLGKSKSLKWTDTTILHWKAVKNAESYKVTDSLRIGKKVYTKTETVNGKTQVDLEQIINELIRANKKALSGAAYVFEASVQAVSTDELRYKDGAAVKAPSLRYLKSSYQESVKRNGWYRRGGKWYFYDAGVMQTGWLTFRGKRYYLDTDGAMLSKCWVGKYYLKTGGEMARNEWVDGYQYFVNKKGIKVSDKAFSTKNWVKTKKGWRCKKKDGTYLKNTWKKIDGRTYYFDQNGYVKTGWFTQDGKKYYLNSAGDITSGYGALSTGWKKVGKYTYWFDDDGAMAKESWVDRGQYYVNKKGHKLSWITYANLRNVNTSNRLGHYIYKKDTPPEQSIASYDLAYRNGNRIMVVDLLFTKDNVPVCFHDNEVKYARLKDGSRPDTAPVVSKMTLAELNKYDYGISKGNAYKGTKLLRLEDMAKWIRKHPDTEMYIEVKAPSMNARQIKKTTALLSKYKITDRSSMIFSVTKASDTRAQRVHKAAPTLRIGITSSRIGNTVYKQLEKAKGDYNHVFLWCWNKTVLSSGTVQKLRSKDVQYELGTLDTFEDIMSYYSKGSSYVYASGIETDGAVFKKLLSAATFHDKAVWERKGTKLKYKQIDGTYAAGKWLRIGGVKYYFDKNGFMVKKTK